MNPDTTKPAIGTRTKREPEEPRTPELLDGDSLSSGQVDRALSDLMRSHRLLFGYGAIRRTLIPRIPKRERPVRIADLGAGPGDVGEHLAKALSRIGIQANVLSIDRKLAHLLAGRRMGYSQHRVVADLRALPIRDDAFDWAISHLVLHHFRRDQNAAILESMLRIGRRVAVVDLAKSNLARWFVPIVLRIIGVGQVALADGIVSIRRASTIEEVRALVAKFRVEELRSRFPFRFSLVIDRGPAEKG